MVDRVDLELAAEALEEIAIADVPRKAHGAATRELGVERPDVEGQHVDRAAIGEAVNQPVCHLSARPGHEHHGSTRHFESPEAWADGIPGRGSPAPRLGALQARRR
jgi:hypothetical protein